MTWMNLEFFALKQDGNYATVQFSSELTAVAAGRYPLPEVDILDGCLAKGTRIRLADGTEREVESFSGGGKENVRSGRSPVGSGRRVLGNTRGVEPIPVVRIEDGDGRSLLLTEKHPVVTQDGVVAARDLEVGDVVLTEAGPRELVMVGRQRYDDEIFNLKLDGSEDEVTAGETTMYANGFLVGDARLQRHLSRQAMERRTERSAAEILEQLPPAWHRDFLNAQKSQRH
jgi:intein/homing endonuclease